MSASANNCSSVIAGSSIGDKMVRLDLVFRYEPSSFAITTVE